MSELVFEKNIQLSKGWTVCKLEDIAMEINSGFASGKHNKSGNGIAHIRPMNIDSSGKINLTVVKYIEDNFKDKLKKDDVLFNNTNSPKLLGKTALIKENTNWGYSNHMTRIRFNSSKVESSWFALFLHKLFLDGYYKQIAKNHVNQSSINSSDLATKIPIIIAPKNEQKRIVSKIESIFAQIDAGKEKLVDVRKLLKQTRQSILKKNFDASSKQYESQKLDNLSIKITDGTHFTPKYEESGIPFISVKNIQNERIYFDNCKYVSQETHEKLIKRCHPEFGDLLITKSGTIGRIAIVDTKVPFSLFVSVALIKLRNNINKNYLKLFFQDFFNHIDISQQIKGVVIKNFHLEDIRQVLIPLPPLNEQKRIVSKIESILGRIDAIENLIILTFCMILMMKIMLPSSIILEN